MAARYAPIHDMATDLLEGLRTRHRPQSVGEAHMLALLADAASRIRGCFCLETEILKRGMEARPQDPPDAAMARVFIRETNGGELLSKLARSGGRLAKEESRSIRVMELHAENRKYADARMAAALAKLQTLHFRYTIGRAPPALPLPSRLVWFRLKPRDTSACARWLKKFNGKEVCV